MTGTTMLIWKVIAANPGIDRAGIWERVEHRIPEGYALRLYLRNGPSSVRRTTQDASQVVLSRARGCVLTLALIHLRRYGHVTWTGEGRDRRYTAARQPRYLGSLDAVDETGTKAAGLETGT